MSLIIALLVAGLILTAICFIDADIIDKDDTNF